MCNILLPDLGIEEFFCHKSELAGLKEAPTNKSLSSIVLSCRKDHNVKHEVPSAGYNDLMSTSQVDTIQTFQFNRQADILWVYLNSFYMA